jgi:hypothetical protein
MNSRLIILLPAACLGLLAAAPLLCASDVTPSQPPCCPPGYQIVVEIQYHEVVRKVCKLVPDVKKTKKVVYSTIDEDFCLPRLRLFGCKEECGSRISCGTPQCRKLLVKKEVVEECPTVKCVVEHVLERIPCKVYRLVPVAKE